MIRLSVSVLFVGLGLVLLAQSGKSLKFVNDYNDSVGVDIKVFDSNSPSCGGAVGNEEQELAARHLDSGQSAVVECGNHAAMCLLWKRSEEGQQFGNPRGTYCATGQIVVNVSGRP